MCLYLVFFQYVFKDCFQGSFRNVMLTSTSFYQVESVMEPLQQAPLVAADWAMPQPTGIRGTRDTRILPECIHQIINVYIYIKSCRDIHMSTSVYL